MSFINCILLYLWYRLLRKVYKSWTSIKCLSLSWIRRYPAHSAFQCLWLHESLFWIVPHFYSLHHGDLTSSHPDCPGISLYLNLVPWCFDVSTEVCAWVWSSLLSGQRTLFITIVPWLQLPVPITDTIWEYTNPVGHVYHLETGSVTSAQSLFMFWVWGSAVLYFSSGETLYIMT